MIVARIQDGQLHIVDRMREMVRLADGLDETHAIRPSVQQSALNCLQRFGQRLKEFPQGAVRAVGTNTLRNASNAAEFLSRAEHALGHPIDIIAGIEEARLIYLGVSHTLATNVQKRLVMDIGGSSTELIVGESFSPVYMESMEMGCVTMTQQFFADGKITAGNIKKAMLHVRLELEPHLSTYLKWGWQLTIGASGTIRAIRNVVTKAGWCKNGITRAALIRLLQTLEATGKINDIRLDGLSTERTPIFIGGVIILLATFEALGIEEMNVSDGALREGLLYDLLGRLQDEDVRSQSVEHMARRYHVDAAQAERVRQCAQYCFNQVAEAWDCADEDESIWLSWAANLHEIGLAIAHSRHHQHAAYIIENSDLPGFTQQEQKVLAILVRSHRRKFPAKVFRDLPKQWQRQGKELAILLRLACILNRSRSATPLPQFQLIARYYHLHLQFPDGWLSSHPLTQGDLEQEAKYLEAVGYLLSFE
jgi:exopolyphosphatase/guanosine-5'-triphosphate,3'-diphosphate pyrophosphatase